MNQNRREAIKRIEDSSLRKVAEEHPDCLHPCVWLVKDEDGPLVAGGNPRLPVGRAWPRVDGKPLAYLLSIDASLLPEWSPLPRDCGQLLLFVGHTVCEMVVVGRGVETREVEPPLEEYLSKYPTAGDVLDSTRFHLEEGLHAGLPASWSPTDEENTSGDWDLTESLTELNRALRPDGYFGRLFGHHEWWTDADPVSITKYSYLDVMGFPEGWYENLDGSVERLQQKLEQAKSQKPLSDEPMPMMADTVVQACEERVAEVETKVAARRDVVDGEARKKVENARRTLARRWKRWQGVKGTDPEAANQALEELMDSASQISREMDHIPITNDPEEFTSQVRAMEETDAERMLQWSQRAMANLKEEARIRREYAHDPDAFKAAMTAFEESKGSKSRYSELLRLLTPLQYACRDNNCDVIRKAWLEYEAKLNEVASELKAGQIATALDWRLQCYQNLVGWLRRGYVDPARVAGKIAAIQWWQSGVQHHEAELAYWRPLLVLDSDGGPYFWGDAGWAIILADQRAVASARLGRLAIAVDVS